MVETDTVTLRAMARATPVRSGLFTVCPVALAAVQLLNSYVNGLSPAVSVPFALVMVSFSVLLVGHSLAEFRLRELERNGSRTARFRPGNRQ